LYEERAVWEHTTISMCGAWLFCMLYNGYKGTIPTTRIFHRILLPWNNSQRRANYLGYLQSLSINYMRTQLENKGSRQMMMASFFPTLLFPSPIKGKLNRK